MAEKMEGTNKPFLFVTPEHSSVLFCSRVPVFICATFTDLNLNIGSNGIPKHKVIKS